MRSTSKALHLAIVSIGYNNTLHRNINNNPIVSLQTTKLAKKTNIKLDIRRMTRPGPAT